MCNLYANLLVRPWRVPAAPGKLQAQVELDGARTWTWVRPGPGRKPNEYHAFAHGVEPLELGASIVGIRTQWARAHACAVLSACVCTPRSAPPDTQSPIAGIGGV